MARVRRALPELLDLSQVRDNHAAVSLVARHFERPLVAIDFPQLERKVAILRKRDMWGYAIPDCWAWDAELFSAFEQSRSSGPYTTSPALIDEFFEDPERCLEQGARAEVALQEAAA